MPEDVEQIAARLAARRAGISEATIQADVRQLILDGLRNSATPLVDVALESPLGDGTLRRIDIEAGLTVVEVKRNLDLGNVRREAEQQLGGYLRRRCDETGARYLGVLTDGRNWYLYVLDPASDRVIAAGPPFTLRSAPDTSALIDWLGAILATQEPVRPTPDRVAAMLGADSPAYAANHATLKALLLHEAKNPEVGLKRELWLKLLQSAFGTAFEDSDTLFVDHTLLVLTAEIVAHAVIGFDISPAGGLSPIDLCSGTRFAEAGIHGVVEADFFDWPSQTAEGRAFIVSLARTVAAFDWSQVDHDVLKHLYESVISTETRQDLGEYYTPDWLADRMLNHVDYEPLDSRVLDASCGSGTFLFHAIQRYLAATDEAGWSNGDALQGLVGKVLGMDLHPVAVALARVTYLLAIGQDRLQAPDRPTSMAIPVYIGDSIQWERNRATLFAGADVVSIPTAGSSILAEDEAPTLFGDDTLDFPLAAMRDSQVFDLMVTRMSDVVQAGTSLTPAQLRSELDRSLSHLRLSKDDKKTLVQTGEHMWRLHISGRNHIWGYYVRNLIRPVWLSLPDNRVDVLVGNPPWLRYNKMTNWMQDRYKHLSEERNLLSGGLGASGRDLAQLFVARACEMYLKLDGQFAYVVPHSLLTRRPSAGFRTGKWSLGRDDLEHLEGTAAFTDVWDLQNVTTGFPITSGVVFGQLTRARAQPLPSAATAWQGRLTPPSQPWWQVAPQVSTTDVDLKAISNSTTPGVSPYSPLFRQGAILVPRRLMFAEPGSANPLGVGRGRTPVVSRATNNDKHPWKVEPLRANVGTEFIYPVLLGESIVPYRVVDPLRAVLPIEDDRLLTEEETRVDDLDPWWSQAERIWRENRKQNEKKPLCERIDYHGQLTAQLAADRSVRVVYSKSGNALAAAVVADPKAVIDHKLYWCPVEGIAEARYLVGILNSSALLERVKPLMAVGLFGPRDFDKYVFHVPFPRFDLSVEVHRELADLSQQAEVAAAAIDLANVQRFQQGRSLIRAHLEATGLQPAIESLVAQILP